MHTINQSAPPQHRTWELLSHELESASLLLFQHNSPDLYEKIYTATASFKHDCQMIQSGQSANAPTVAFYGTLKSFNYEILSALLPVQTPPDDIIPDSDEVTWFGPTRSSTAGSNHITTHLNLSTPIPFALAFSNAQECPETIKATSVKILTTQMSSLRDGAFSKLLNQMDGSIIIPIIRYNPKTKNNHSELFEEYQIHFAKWKNLASSIKFLDPIFLPDPSISGDIDAFNSIAQTSIEESLVSILSDFPTLESQTSKQLLARESRVKREVSSILTDFKNRLGSTIEELKSVDESLSQVLSEEFIGNKQQLHLGLRSRFRADVLDRTHPLLFPFRSLLGILGLTQGAWDRLIFTSIGSIPSLVMTTIHSLKLAKSTKDFQASFKDLAESRIHSRITDNCVDRVRIFYNALRATNQEESTTSPSQTIDYEHLIRVQGISGLQIASGNMITKTVKKHRLRTRWLLALGLLGTGVFWILLSGPIISLYIQYAETLRSTYLTGEWQKYPTPTVSLWISSILLSLAPAFAVAMILMQVACGKQRIDVACSMLEDEIEKEIISRIQKKQLAITLNDPKLDAARFFINITH